MYFRVTHTVVYKGETYKTDVICNQDIRLTAMIEQRDNMFKERGLPQGLTGTVSWEHLSPEKFREMIRGTSDKTLESLLENICQ